MLIEKRGEFTKAHDGIIYGWAVVSTIKSASGAFEPYIDLAGDWIPDDTLPGVAAEFMASARVGKDMHAGEQIAEVVFCLPVTQDIAKGLGLELDRTGLVIGWKPYDKAILDRVANGERVGFSIGGWVTDSDEHKSLSKNASTEKANQHKRTFRSWKLAEISLVDAPCQEGALVGIVKRKPLARTVTKASLFTDEVDGHQHLIDLDCFAEDGTCSTSWATSEGAEYGHSHAVARDAQGAITILADSGHTHQLAPDQPAVVVVPADAVVVVQARDPKAPARAAHAKSTRPIATPKVDTMKTDAEKLADLQKSHDRLSLIVKLAPEQRTHFDSLQGDAQDEFLAKSAAERTEIVKAATEVVHTCVDGTAIYKRDGALALRLAKQADEALKTANAEKSARETVELAKRADTVLAVVKADDGSHVELLRAVEAIADTKKRDAVMATLKILAVNTKLGKSAPGFGGSETPTSGMDAHGAFNTKLAEFAKSLGKSPEAATEAFLGTADGVELYAATRPRVGA